MKEGEACSVEVDGTAQQKTGGGTKNVFIATSKGERKSVRKKERATEEGVCWTINRGGVGMRFWMKDRGLKEMDICDGPGRERKKEVKPPERADTMRLVNARDNDRRQSGQIVSSATVGGEIVPRESGRERREEGGFSNIPRFKEKSTLKKGASEPSRQRRRRTTGGWFPSLFHIKRSKGEEGESAHRSRPKDPHGNTEESESRKISSRLWSRRKENAKKSS